MRERRMIKKFLVLSAVMTVTFALAIPAVADQPTVEVFPPEVLWTVENPCSESFEVVNIVVTTTLKEHLHLSGRVTVVDMTVTGEGGWVGHGTDTGVELNQGETVFHKLIVSHSETGQKFQLTVRGHFNNNTGEWNVGDGPVFTVTCVKT